MSRQFAIALAVGAALGFGAAHALSNAAASPPATEILTENGAILFMVNGQEQARIDVTGLRVNGDVSYSGSLVDTVASTSATARPTGDSR